jgi:hypothetical protein
VCPARPRFPPGDTEERQRADRAPATLPQTPRTPNAPIAYHTPSLPDKLRRLPQSFGKVRSALPVVTCDPSPRRAPVTDRE